jgi:FKBP-type peptidyl-prolyl cis-trans isomerase FklB
MNKVAFICVLIKKTKKDLMKKAIICIVGSCLICMMTSGQTKAKPQAKAKPQVKKEVPAPRKPQMKNLNDSFSYAAGLSVGKNMQDQGITSINAALMVKAIEDVFNNNSQKLLTEEVANNKLQEQLMAYKMQKKAAEKAKGDAFLNENKKRSGVVELPGGLQYEVIKVGALNGPKPTAVDTVVVNYKGSLIDGTEFDNSYKRGEPATFAVGGVIKGWTDILQMMTKGAEWKVYIPSSLGYGERGAGASIPPNATLIFEISLLDIKPAAK